MSSEAETVTKQGSKAEGLVPKLRFPEFRDGGEWVTKPLGEFASLIDERAGSRQFIPLSITSGVGLISQEEKFGRTIAGQQLKNYLVLRKGDFAYNKSATKLYPQGYAVMYQGDEVACVPSSIFACFSVTDNSVAKSYINYQLSANLHGRWLSRFTTIGARANGSLNVDDNDLLALPVPLPEGPAKFAEQQKIADFLTSLDALITVETDKLAALWHHKKGLMQRLFPRPERVENGVKVPAETTPRFRFPEFRNARQWETTPLGDIFDTASGGTPDRKKKEFWDGEIPWITTSLVDGNIVSDAAEFITVEGLKGSSAKIFPKNTVLIAMYGQGKTRGKVALLGIEAATNQACAAILPKAGIDPAYVFVNLCARYEEIRSLSNSGGQDNLSQELVGSLPFPFPHDKNEQRKVAECLLSFDTLITAQDGKIEALKAHKSGLMRQLFPLPAEAVA